MIDREKDEQRDEQGDEQQQSAEVEDLDVTSEEAEDVKGGKVSMQDFHFTSQSTKSSP